MVDGGKIKERMAELGKKYGYTLIRDAKKTLNLRMNLFAKVSDIGTAKKSRGTDHVVTLKLIDHSCPKSGLKVNVFAATDLTLPKVQSAGDIISLHHVEVKVHNGEVYCVFTKQVSSFAIYYGKTDMGLSPYQTSARYRESNHANDLLLQLRSLPLESPSDAGLAGSLVLLRSIEIGKFFDIICKVIYIQEISEGDWMLYVWDGTDSPPVAFETDLDHEREKPTPLLLEARPLSREILCNFPHEGTVLRINTRKFFEDIQSLQGVGSWVKFCNVVCELQSGMWKAVMTHYSKAKILSDDDDGVKYRQRIYDERMASNLERMPLASFPGPSDVTETDYEHMPYSTLMDSLTHSQVLHKFKCVVRVVASCPWRGEDLYSPVDGRYRIRLTLEDPTARIQAYVYDKEGEKLFGGKPAPIEVSKKMNKLLGVEGPERKQGPSVSRNPPWIWCCIWSYYTDEKDPWSSRRYRIFGTKVVD